MRPRRIDSLTVDDAIAHPDSLPISVGDGPAIDYQSRYIWPVHLAIAVVMAHRAEAMRTKGQGLTKGFWTFDQGKNKKWNG